MAKYPGRCVNKLCIQVALQDHYARLLQIPGAKLKPASLKPVSSYCLLIQSQDITASCTSSSPVMSFLAISQRSLQGTSLTLAQRHGLVKAPPKLLSEQQWLSTHAKSTARQDSQHECSICCEHFGLGEQVLLSCSHVFHKQCITSFERYD